MLSNEAVQNRDGPTRKGLLASRRKSERVDFEPCFEPVVLNMRADLPEARANHLTYGMMFRVFL